MSAGDWPTIEEFRQVLDVDPDSHAQDVTLQRVLDSAIAKVKADTGAWDDLMDIPDDMLAQAALRMAELMALRPEGAVATITDPTYNRLMFGHMRRFSLS